MLLLLGSEKLKRQDGDLVSFPLLSDQGPDSVNLSYGGYRLWGCVLKIAEAYGPVSDKRVTSKINVEHCSPSFLGIIAQI